ncbi:related to Superkiller protein 3 [Saccharomycodes ludwigii]|uniref:Related to Superkiller protein 3 n=1 Tax=Saccharomycodes ludwigii TaxID=36035 RepID=A0A376B5U4_9ASCO|nr:hypothetical protein SCDLUD_000012 [Saccharomycodes ludwigii]KAH3902435.1 hypothetical protein SCDLUD_000012 [Saccharomycodes ludwigii]SSD59490.1 related to Superkiller protein 3 [Saccharomycodes ludwigii]
MASQVKIYLKNAKQALQAQNYELAADFCHDVLEEDPNNYFAHLFSGKCYDILNLKDKGLKHYLKAIEIDKNNVLGWKGLFLLLKTHYDRNVLNYNKLFELCYQYYEILVTQNSSIQPLIDFVRDFKKSHGDCEKTFLQNMVPGQHFAETLGAYLMKPQDALQKLLNIALHEENSKVSTVKAKRAMGLSPNDPQYQEKLNEIVWDIYKDSEVKVLYSKLINLIDDDDERKKLEEENFFYKLKVLKTMPQDIKWVHFKELKETVEDMVLLNHNSDIVWNYYFEWQDYNSLDDFDCSIISRFIKKFPSDPLGNIFFGYISSSFSKYNKQEFYKLNSKDENETIEADEDEDDDSDFTLTEDDIFSLLLDSVAKTQKSILSHRILSAYCIQSLKYKDALKFIQKGIQLSYFAKRDFGIQLENTKNDLTLNLALAYTHVDSPKNHSAALQLYNKYLSQFPDDTKAEVGKSLIFIEQKNWTEAAALLKHVIKTDPEDMTALSDFCWAQMHLGEVDMAIEKFKVVLKNISGTDILSLRNISTNLWRLAVCYIEKYKTKQTTENMDYINMAFKHLIGSIKVSVDFAPGFSTLGKVYNEYYHDKSRAFKCYFKAFEINPGDIIAAKYMVGFFTDNKDWENAAKICQRLVDAELAKRELQMVNWPYRVLGVSCLESRDSNGSIGWFQSALRVDSSDIESWIGLGQAYLYCGRIEASYKAFLKATELDCNHNYAFYFLGISLSKLYRYDEAVDVFEKLLRTDPSNVCFITTFAHILSEYSSIVYTTGGLSRSIDLAVYCIEQIENAVCIYSVNSYILWNTLANCLKIFILLQTKLSLLPIERLVNVFEKQQEMTKNSENSFEFKHNLTVESLFENVDNIKIAANCLLLSSQCAFYVEEYKNLNRTLRAYLWYNLGCSELLVYQILKDIEYEQQAILAFKESIKFQSNVVDAWIGLGLATLYLNYKVSQHCFIKALTISPKNYEVWCCLSLLALKNNDVAFALETSRKAQTMNPESYKPWFYMALALEKSGDNERGNKLLRHINTLSKDNARIIPLFYAKAVLEQRIGNGSSEKDIELQQDFTSILHGLEQYLKKIPDDIFAIQCSLLAYERLHDYTKANVLCDKLTSIIEQSFEQSKNDTDLFHYAVIKSQFSRIKLGMGSYDEAIEDAELSTGILLDHEHSKSLLLSNYCCLGLSNYFKNDFDSTLQYFQLILDSSEVCKELILLISKVLYNVDSDETKELSMQELADYASAHSGDMEVSLTMAAISLIEKYNVDDLNTILKEITSLPLSVLCRDYKKNVPFLIEELNKRIGTSENKLAQIWQKSTFFFPNSRQSWEKLDDKIAYQVGCNEPNRMNTCEKTEQLIRLKNKRMIQRGLFLTPWNENAINALKECF